MAGICTAESSLLQYWRKLNKEFAESNGELKFSDPEKPPLCGRNKGGFRQIPQNF